MNDHRKDASHEETNPGLSPLSLATQRLPIAPDPFVPPDPQATQKLPTFPAPRPPAASATLPLEIRPAFPEARPEAAPAPPPAPAPSDRSRLKHWAFGILAVLILGGSLGYYLLNPAPDAPSAFTGAQEEIPPPVRPYLDRANQGDIGAMRMLGTMYYNGLNVPQNRKEGLKWYRKAAAAGSIAARNDLEQLGLSVEEK